MGAAVTCPIAVTILPFVIRPRRSPSGFGRYDAVSATGKVICCLLFKGVRWTHSKLEMHTNTCSPPVQGQIKRRIFAHPLGSTNNLVLPNIRTIPSYDCGATFAIGRVI